MTDREKKRYGHWPYSVLLLLKTNSHIPGIQTAWVIVSFRK